MAHHAEVIGGIVQQVIVIDAETLATGHWGDPANWVQASYNTHGGVHALGGTPLRMNYPGKGYHYDGIGFYAPQPFPSWTKDPATYLWNAPTPMPTDGKHYTWDEPTLTWKELAL